MASALYQRASAFCSTRMSSSLLQTASRVAGSSGALSNPFLGQASNLDQQVCFKSNITKAKKKRRIRYKINLARAARGEVIRPPKWIDPQVRVQNSIPREEANEIMRQEDEEDAKFVEERRAAVQDIQPLRHQMTGLEMSDRVKKLFDMKNGNQMEVVAFQKASGMKLFHLREADTGSTPVQIIALTSRIQQLQTHMRTHKKDMSTKRGLQKLVVRRRKLLDYLERKDFVNYRRIVKSLGLARR